MGTRLNPILGCIKKYSDMFLLYDLVWVIGSQYTGVNHIIICRNMGLFKLLCSIWNIKNDLCGCRSNFSGMFKNSFQETLHFLVHAFSGINHKAFRNKGFIENLNKIQKETHLTRSFSANGFKDYSSCFTCVIQSHWM